MIFAKLQIRQMLWEIKNYFTQNNVFLVMVN